MGKIVCPPDCPDRSSTCHAGCERYAAFVRVQAAEYDRRILRRKYAEMLTDRTRRIRRRMGWK